MKPYSLDLGEKIREVCPSNLIFLDEMGILLGIIRVMIRSKKVERVYDSNSYAKCCILIFF